jgi:hypothetical protein
MALSAIEDRYLSALTEREFPTFTPMEAEMAAPEGVDSVQLAAGPSGTVSDAGSGMPEIRATPRNQVMGGVADFVRGVRDLANQYEIKDFVPLLGGMGVGDLLLGKSPEELEEWAYGNLPMRVPEMSNVPIVKTGRKEQLMDTMFLGVDAAGIGKGAGVVGKAAAKNLGPKAAEMAETMLQKQGLMPAIVERTTAGSPSIKREEFTAYQNQPQQLQGFPKGGPSKSFDEQKYKHAEFVEVKFEDGTTHLDAIRGLNKTHALSRAFGNWPNATEIKPLARSEVEQLDPDLLKEVDAVMPKQGAGVVPDGPSATPLPPDAPIGKVVNEQQVETPNFKRWFGDWQAAPEAASKVVDDKGTPLAVFHGTARPDRVGTNFKKSRATSGPMSFFTDDPEVASGYAKGKQDTSLAYEETDYANWFKKKDGRSTINLDQAGARMSSEERQSVLEKLRDINMTDDGEIVYQPGGGTIMSDSSFDFYLQREAKGNPLKLAKQLWLESGTLYNDEEKFAKVLQLAGVKGFDADFPNASYPAVYKVFLDIKNPFDTATITPEFVAELEAAASKIRKRAATSGADNWDKNTIGPKEWIARLQEDMKNNTTFAWTSIPDWVTERLKAKGYDGIKDMGGKSVGSPHTVWIPFEETQVKSAMGNIGTFDPSKKNILRGAGAGGSAAGTATMQDKENE